MKLHFLEIVKKMILGHAEKILLVILILVWAFTVVRATTSIIHEMSREAPIDFTIANPKQSPTLNIPSSEEYESILTTVQESIHLSEKDLRDIFSKSREETLQHEKWASGKLDTDQDGMPDEWEIRYNLDPTDLKDAKSDKDEDHYSNLDEYIGGSDPTDPNSFPGLIKLKLLKIFKQGIRVNFFGYIKLPDGSFQIQINWGRQTAFLKIDQEIRGYKIIEFSEESEKKFNPQINADEILDTSHIKIQKKEENPIKLVVGHPSFEKELYAIIEDSSTGKRYQVHAGSQINSYKVLDITSSKVIVSRDKRSYTLQ
ncbi:MAG: hypothetical protein HYS07_01455 [Chlamydiae bacterium]|nr:hypothetical protein [Chlamydiota bacterium]MBI3277788.1 hypothetical protein [Chlamydiota bacterium]